MAGKAVHELTDSNFQSEVLNSDMPILVDFWAEWCMPCKMLGPTIDQLAADYQGKAKIGKVDTDSNQQVSAKFNITAIPTVMIFKDGQLVRKFVGVVQKKDFVSELQKLAPPPAA